MATGLLNEPLDGTRKKTVLGQEVFTADTDTYDPTLRTVKPETETVAGQMKGLMDTPFAQQVRTSSTQNSNARGLVNSSIAVGAAEDAVIRNSLPIAGADADIFGTASRENQAATNRSFEFNAGAKNTAALNNANQLNQFPLQKAQADSAKVLADIDAQYKTVMQTSASAAQLMSVAQQSLGELWKDPNLNKEAKTAASGQIYAGLQAQLGVLGGMANLDLSGMLTFPTGTAGATITPEVVGDPNAPTNQPGPTAPGKTDGEISWVNGIPYVWKTARFGNKEGSWQPYKPTGAQPSYGPPRTT